MIVHRSQRADVLARALAAELRSTGRDPIVAEQVVVGGRAAERWLETRIAQELGVAANLRFLSPSTLVEELLASVFDQPRERADAWRTERLMWAVLRVLPLLLEDERFAPVRFYLGAQASEPGSARFVGLARRIAESFARYASARPDTVMQWQTGDASYDRTRAARQDDDWQPVLWRALRETIDVPHVAELARDLDKRLDRSDAARAALPTRVLWWTHASAARLHLEVLRTIARHGVHVQLFLLSPSRGAVARVRDARQSPDVAVHELTLPLGNALLESLWRPCRDVELLLTALDTDRRDEHRDLFVEPDARTTLGALQAELLECASPASDDAKREIVPHDRSLTVHACHGPMRQVEVLRDELLRLFDDDPSLQPRDVLVLTPSLDEYAPLVDAVFASSPRARARERGGDRSAASSLPPSIPVRVAGQPLRRENAAVDVLLRVLELASSRADALSVLDLLATPALSARFGFGDADHERLRTWVRETGIRCNVDAAHREEHELPPSHEHTWRFGIDRLLLGHAMAGEERTLFAGVLPYDYVEGSIGELAGRFAEACDKIFHAARSLQAPRAIASWRGAITGALSQLVGDGADFVMPLRILRGALDEMVDAAQSDEPLSLGAVRLLLGVRFDEPATMRGSGAGAVTLCALQPGRTVNARVVALLGMDDGKFPRARTGAGFDLLVSAARVGDADPCADDRLRMLEAVVGAEERLIVTYTGRSLETNEEIAPCVPVGELLDAIDGLFLGARDDDGKRRPAHEAVVVHHPLQPFSPRNFDGDAGAARGYEPMWMAGAKRLLGEQRPAPAFITRALPLESVREDAEREIALDDLARWIGAPAEQLLRSALKLRLDGGEEELEPREPVEVDALQRWQLADTLLRQSLDDENLSPREMYALRAASGALPQGSVGRVAFDEALTRAFDVKRALVELLREPAHEPIDVRVTVGGACITGRLHNLFGEGILQWKAGTVHGKHLLDLWVRHLVLHLVRAESAPTSAIVGRDDKNVGVWRLGPVADAQAELEKLVELYDEAHERLLPLFSKTSHAYAASLARAPDDDAKAEAAARRKWVSSFEGGSGGECNDVYLSRTFGGVDPLAHNENIGAEFRRLAVELWKPVLDHMSPRP